MRSKRARGAPRGSRWNLARAAVGCGPAGLLAEPGRAGPRKRAPTGRLHHACPASICFPKNHSRPRTHPRAVAHANASTKTKASGLHYRAAGMTFLYPLREIRRYAYWLATTTASRALTTRVGPRRARSMLNNQHFETTCATTIKHVVRLPWATNSDHQVTGYFLMATGHENFHRHLGN